MKSLAGIATIWNPTHGPYISGSGDAPWGLPSTFPVLRGLSGFLRDWFVTTVPPFEAISGTRDKQDRRPGWGGRWSGGATPRSTLPPPVDKLFRGRAVYL